MKTSPSKLPTLAFLSSAQAKRFFLFMLKIGVTIIAFYVISGSVSWGGFKELYSNFQPLWFAVAILVFLAAQIVSSLRCLYVARALGGDLDFISSIRAHFVGLWFNQVLPTGLGGDVVKIAILKHKIGLGIATRAAIIDRVSGLMILMFLLFVQFPLYTIYFQNPNWAIGLALLSSVSFVGVLFLAWFANRLNGRFQLPFAIRHLVALFADIWFFRRGRLLWEQFWTSLIVHLNGVVSFGLIGLSLGIDVDPVLFLLVVPLVFLVALMPLSLAGWGIREAGAVWLFSIVGVSAEGALGMSVGFGMLLLISGVPGLIVWMVKK